MTELERIERWNGQMTAYLEGYLLYLRLPSIPKKPSCVCIYDLYSHRRCRFRSFRAPMRITLSGSCRSIEVAVFLSPICCGSFCHRCSGYLDIVARESCRVASGTVSCPTIFLPSFLESRGPGTVLLTVPWLSQWIAGLLHNASG